MKSTAFRYLFLFITGIFIYSCGQDRKPVQPVPDDPAFQHPSVKVITDRINENPADASLYYQRGNALHNLKADTLAITDFQKAISLDSTKAEYYSAIGGLMFDHKDITGSVKWLEKAISLNPEDPSAHLRYAKLLIYTKEFPKAFSEINIVMRQNVYNPETYFLKGMIYKDLYKDLAAKGNDTAAENQFSKAISSFQSAINASPDYKDAYTQLGQLYSEKNNPIALKYYDNAFRADTSDVFPLFAKGVFYHHQKDLEQAKQQYRQCVIRDNQYADAYYNLGFIYMDQDSFEKAFRQFDLLTKISPNDAEAYYNRGFANEKMGKKAEALNDYKQALTFDDQYAEAKEGAKRVAK